MAQSNAWTKATDGFWEEPYWSLGIAPGTNQSLAFDNSGSKTLTINSNTAVNFPETLSVRSLRISGTSTSPNFLLMDHVGLQTPLQANDFFVAQNSALTLLGSAVQINSSGYEGLAVGGRVDQNAGSRVTGLKATVGYIGPGVYNLNDGIIDVADLWIGGTQLGVFNQYGGTNKVGVLHFDPGGTYNLMGGVLDTDIYFNRAILFGVFVSGSITLHQRGGEIKRPLNIFRGGYLLDNGISSGATVPVSVSYPWSGTASAVQSGGTNVGPLNIGSWGSGSYVLSNGVSIAPSLTVGPLGAFLQHGGNQIVTAKLSVTADWTARERWSLGRYELYQGALAVGGMDLLGTYTQAGGSNYVSGDVTLKSSISGGNAMKLTGGVLTENNLIINYRSVIQGAGLHTIKSNLTIYGRGTDSMPYGGYEYDLAGGQLTVSNLTLGAANMTLSPGRLVQHGMLTMGGGKLLPRAGSHEIGVLNLDVWDAWTNSTIMMPANAGCVLRFPSSWHLIWARAATLTITHWTGSLSGNGTHQIIFGTNRLGATPIQLSQIRFENPLGLRGSFPARILPTGEIVPGRLLRQQPSGRQMMLEWDNDFVLQSAPSPVGPYSDVTTSTSPLMIDPNLPQQFFRLRQPW